MVINSSDSCHFLNLLHDPEPLEPPISLPPLCYSPEVTCCTTVRDWHPGTLTAPPLARPLQMYTNSGTVQ